MEDEDSLRVPVWITLPGLPPNYFQESILQSIGNGFGRYLKRDNATACVTRSKAVLICVELDASLPLLKSFCLGPPGLESSHFQEVIFESNPSFCVFYRKQDHLENKCLRRQEKGKRDKKIGGEMEGKKNGMKHIWKVVGNREDETNFPVKENEVGESSKARRNAILEKIQERRESIEEDLSRVWFISLDGALHDSCMDASNVQVRVGDDFNSCGSKDVEINVPLKELISNSHESWFEAIEEESEGQLQEKVDLAEPRSSLRLVDEALEFELGGLGDKEFFCCRRCG